jgi:uncharacterized protein YcbX
MVFIPDDIERPVSPRRGRPGDRGGFADGYPLLLTTEASLDALNRRLEEPVPMSRFRPNPVVDGELPFGEDGWSRIRAGGAGGSGRRVTAIVSGMRSKPCPATDRRRAMACQW